LAKNGMGKCQQNGQTKTKNTEPKFHFASNATQRLSRLAPRAASTRARDFI
jgi:hypothetical protein